MDSGSSALLTIGSGFENSEARKIGRPDSHDTRSGFKLRPALPNRVGGIERKILMLGSLEETEFHEARNLGQLRVAYVACYKCQ